MTLNRLYDFDVTELALIHASLTATAQLAQVDDTAPSGLLETAISALEKIQQVIEIRCNDYNEFQSLANSSLTDLHNELEQIATENNNNNETENN